MTEPLRATETELIGAWTSTVDGVVRDKTSERIDDLTRNLLVRVAESPDGWSTLFRDPQDGRYWEMTYPESSQHGGGPPRLASIDTEDAESRYGLSP
jgi:immunity protein 27 of polymorphic toxin system